MFASPVTKAPAKGVAALSSLPVPKRPTCLARKFHEGAVKATRSMQQGIGNQASLHLLAAASEQSTLQRKCAKCEGDDKVHRKAVPVPVPAGGSTAPPLVHSVLRSLGQPLSLTARAFMEPRFRQDFSGLRIHADTPAAESAGVVGASGYTVGDHIVLAADHRELMSPDGKKLLAHELAHVVQQRGGTRTLRRHADSLYEDQTGPDQPDEDVQTDEDNNDDSAQLDDVEVEPDDSDEISIELAAVDYQIAGLKAAVASATRDRSSAESLGSLDVAGETVCDPDTGKPHSSINRIFFHRHTTGSARARPPWCMRPLDCCDTAIWFFSSIPGAAGFASVPVRKRSI